MLYNIYLNSPQLAYNANQKKYYLFVIQKNKIINMKNIKKYPPIYFRTSFDDIYYPNQSSIPY